MKADFIHLNLQSEYSTLESCCSLAKIQDECNYAEFPAVALTDSNTLGGAIKFYKACHSGNNYDGSTSSPIKPIIGQKVSVVNSSDINDIDLDLREPMILLAENNDGFDNMKKLSHSSHMKDLPKPLITYDELEELSDGIICIPTTLNGSVQRHLRRKKEDEAINVANKLKGIFGDRLYLELQDNGQVDQDIVNSGIMRVCESVDIKPVATNDVRYYRREHHLALLVLQAKKQRKTIRSKKFTAIRSQERYLKTADEMKKVFKDFPNEVLHNSVEIAERCNVYLTFGGMRLPEFPLPEGFDDDWSYLKHLAYIGLKEKGFHGDQRYIDRLEEELFDVAMIYETEKYNFARYFLMVWDYVNFALSKKTRVGVGRGCFTPECKVMCRGGSKNISDISVGEEVLSYDGKYHEVLNTLDYDVNEEILEIEMEDGRKFSCTKDHKIHVVRNGELEWVEAGDLNEDDDIFDIISE